MHVFEHAHLVQVDQLTAMHLDSQRQVRARGQYVEGAVITQGIRSCAVQEYDSPELLLACGTKLFQPFAIDKGSADQEFIAGEENATSFQIRFAICR